MSKRNEWDGLGEAGQYRMILGTVAKVAKRSGLSVNPADYAGETWLKVAELLDRCEELDLPLIVWRAATSALNREEYQRRKYAAADAYTVTGADGDALGTILDLVADSGSVEAEAVLRVDFSRFYEGLDALDRQLLQERAAGRTFREMDAGRSKAWRRLRKIREAAGAFLD